MKVFINAVSAKMGGFKTIIEYLYENLPDDDNEYHILIYKNIIKDQNKKNIKLINSDVGDWNYIKRYIWYNTKYNFFLKKYKYDICLNLTNYGPLKCFIPQVLFIQNAKHVSKEILKEYNLKNKFKSKVENFILKLSLNGADRVIVQTDFMKDGIVKKYGYNNKINVIHNSINKKNIKIDNKLEKKILMYKEEKKMLLSCITLYAPYKNLYLLIDAIKELEIEGKNIGLILTISYSEGIEATRFLEYIKKKNFENSILNIGNIPNDYLGTLLNHSDIFVYPSYMESFGVPFVEAMSYELPIIASDLGFAHDVCKDAAEYFKYDNINQLKNTILKFYNNPNLIKYLSENSKKRYEEIKKENFVEKYIDVLKEVLEER